jgi:hypothetical protein
MTNIYEKAIGKKCFKPSGKPFKSKLDVNTISGVAINPHTLLDAFTFVEDDSVVDCRSVVVKDWSIRNHLGYEVGRVDASHSNDPVAVYACDVNAPYSRLLEAGYTYV